MYEERETYTVYQRERRITLWPLALILVLGGGLAAIPLFAPAVIAPAALLLGLGLGGTFAPAVLILAIGKARQLNRDAETRRIMAERIMALPQANQETAWRLLE